jgi:ABC-type transporter Mla subunit MlaD
MALQDLTPQLRTRLSRMERAVGWFVFLAVLLLAFGFVYYVYTTAERKGWFVIKARYYTFVDTATGLKLGDPVMLMGFDAGTITDIKPMPAEQFMYNVYVEFELKAPNYGYIWSEGSRARVATADLLGKRVLEVTKGSGGYPTYTFFPLLMVNVQQLKNLPDASNYVLGEEIYDPSGTNLLAKPLQRLLDLPDLTGSGYTNVVALNTNAQQKAMTGIWEPKLGHYIPFNNKGYYLVADESPAVTEQIQRMVTEVEQALPNVLTLTNSLATALSKSVNLISNLNLVAVNAQPVVSNLARATQHLDEPGSLGDWLIPTNLNWQLTGTLSNANLAVVSVNTNLNAVMENVSLSLDSVANLTSNLNQQVIANSNILSSVSSAVTHADEFVQGLKRFWLFRHLFKSTNAPAARPAHVRPIRSPRDTGQAR